MKNWFYSLTKGKQIAIFVLLVHCALLISLMIDHWMSAPSFKKTKLTVNTVIINSPPPPKPTPVQTTKKQVAKPATGSPQKQAVKPKNSPPKKEILQQIESSLQSISTPIAAPKPEISVPIFYDPPPIVAAETPSPANQIAAYLQEALELPEFGEVKVFLSMDRFGRLVSVEILEAKSAKNAEFLKNRLPELQFPWLNEATSLTIVFSNAP